MAHKPVIAMLTAFTLLNIAWNGWASESSPVRPSLLEVGDVLPELRLREASCQLLVAFRSDCPFCSAAAQRERQSWGTGSLHPLPVTWVAAAADSGAAAYRQRISEAADLVISDSLFAAMRVVGVPFAVYLRGDTVSAVTSYDGRGEGESIREHVEACRETT